MKLGVPERYAHMAANSRRGYWFTANTGAVKRGITNERLIRAGFFELSPAYESIRFTCIGRAVYIHLGAVADCDFLQPGQCDPLRLQSVYAQGHGQVRRDHDAADRGDYRIVHDGLSGELMVPGAVAQPRIIE